MATAVGVDVSGRSVAVPDVADPTWPQVQVPFEAVEFSGFGMPKVIVGRVAGADHGRDRSAVEAAQGRLLAAGDEESRVTVLGSDLARELDVAVGDTLDLRGVAFDVVGILQPTLSSPDTTAMVPLAAGQELFLDTLPPTLGAALDASELASQIIVYPTDAADDPSVRGPRRPRRQ